MAYTSVRGGAEAIAAAERLIAQLPTEPDEALLELRQVRNQLRAAVDQVMGEGGLYAPDLAALALRQAEGDMAEAAFMVRAYRSTLPRLGYTHPVRGDEMLAVRRISSTFRDVPGGQLLGRTRDYTQRLLDLAHQTSNGGVAAPSMSLNGQTDRAGYQDGAAEGPDLPHWDGRVPKVSDAMRAMRLIEPLPSSTDDTEPVDITRASMRFPVGRSAWLQAMARGETGALVCLAYSAMRGYGGGDHGTIADLRVGDLPVRLTHPLTGKPMTIGHIRVTEVEMTGRTRPREGDGKRQPPYGLSYGLVFGQNERKAISMALLDSALMAGSSGEGNPAPANDQEMVLYHTDGIESFGFVEHLKLPHFVTFGSGLQVSLEDAGVNGSAPPPSNGRTKDGRASVSAVGDLVASSHGQAGAS
jgi:alpha-D-ribose 1-methylphosphonate 5-triphosphate synthase subunit PhnI